MMELSRRDLLAGMAMQGILASETNECHYASQDKAMKTAVEYTDLLIAELDKTSPHSSHAINN